MAVCAQCQVPLTLAGTVRSIWGALWQQGHLGTAGVRVPLPGRDNGQPCRPSLALPPSWQTWQRNLLENINYTVQQTSPHSSKRSCAVNPNSLSFIYIDSTILTLLGYDGLYFGPVIFCLRVVAVVYKQLSSSLLLCSCLCLRWGSMQAGWGGWAVRKRTQISLNKEAVSSSVVD